MKVIASVLANLLSSLPANKMPMRRIFLTSTIRQPFILEDAGTLGQQYDLHFYVGSGPLAALRMFLQALRAECSVCWFASVYSLAVVVGARLAGRRSIIIVGGVDAAAIPDLGYGIWLNRWKAALVRRALAWTDQILPVDDSLLTSLRRLSGLPLKHAVVLPTGYDAGYWCPAPGDSAERHGVLCVATCNSVRRAKVKGIDVLLAAATALPDVPFTVIGVDPHFMEQMPFAVPENVRLLPAVTREELLEHYRSALVYCQPSRHEGLPNALCEAMLCGAVPVGTEAGGMPGAIGECGVVVKSDDADGLREGLLRAMNMPTDTGTHARARIGHVFSKERREEGLMAAVRGTLRPSGEMHG